MSTYELAQLNIGLIGGPIDSPIMPEFVTDLDRINLLAEGSPGFVRRLQTPEGSATAIRPFQTANMLIDMSVWENVGSLRKFVYRSAHADILRRRREWFEKISEAILVLWWVPRGHRPSVEEAIARLELLRRNGAHPEAFTFGETYPPPDAQATEQPGSFEDECPAT